MRIGVISDTHGLLRPEALEALAGVARIIHAGDVGKGEILAALGRIAPVTAVRGNVDTRPPAAALPLEASLVLNGQRVHVLHDLKALAFDPAAAGIALVIAGHSHRPGAETRGGVVYLNPGSAGPQRFGLPVTLATVEIGAAGILPRIHALDGAARGARKGRRGA